MQLSHILSVSLAPPSAPNYSARDDAQPYWYLRCPSGLMYIDVRGAENSRYRAAEEMPNTPHPGRRMIHTDLDNRTLVMIGAISHQGRPRLTTPPYRRRDQGDGCEAGYRSPLPPMSNGS